MARHPFAIFSFIAVFACMPLPASDAELRVRPGPKTISAEERAIESDPSAGVEHAVILVEETELNESYGTSVETNFHLRAKILSNQARDLANIEIPLDDRDRLTGWWGFVLLPDGKVLEVEEEELTEQDLVRSGRWAHRALKVPLPGVVPGAVIDYGYTVKGETRYRFRNVTLQKRWPILRFAYRWRPTDYHPSAFRVYRSENLDVNVERRRRAVLVEAHDLPPVPEEPYMPPDFEVRSSMILYYLNQGESYKDYWNERAKEIDEASRRPAQESLIAQAIAALDRSADTMTRLQAAYDWILANVENPLARSSGASKRGVPVSLGAQDSLDQLFIDVARELGAEAQVVLSPDRTRNYWDPQLRTLDQFESRLVAVYLPGQDDRATLVDPSSGLGFGEIPWWVSGVEGLLATPKGAQSVFVPPSDATRNIARTRVELGFSADGEVMSAKSVRVARGQSGIQDAQRVSGLTGTDRQERLDLLCGASPDVEITHSESVIGYPGMTAKLDCESEHFLDEPVESGSRYVMDWTGPWLQALPDLPPGARVHPVVFDFPYIEILEMEVSIPEGFRPIGSRAPVSVVTPYGKYERTISATTKGFTVQRALALLPVGVPAEEYDELLDFLDQARRGDSARLVFEKADEGE